MSWTGLKAAIAAVIKTNGNKEITGQLLQDTLNSIVDQVGENATYKGVAVLSTAPGTPDGPVFYLAHEKGVYPNFSGLEITTGGLYALSYLEGVWSLTEALGDILQRVNLAPRGLSFTSGLLSIIPESSLYPNANWTVEMYVKFKDIVTVQNIAYNGVGLPGFGISDYKLNVAVGGVAVQGEFSLGGLQDKDIFITVTYDGANHAVKIDDVVAPFTVVSSDAYAQDLNALSFGSFVQGVQPTNFECYLFRISDNVLSDAELALRYNDGLPLEYVLEKDDTTTLELHGDNAGAQVWQDTSIHSYLGNLSGEYKVKSSKADTKKLFEANRVETPVVKFTAGLAEFNPRVSLFPNSAWTIEIKMKVRDVATLGALLNPVISNLPVLYFLSGELILGKNNIGASLTVPGANFLDKDVLMTAVFDGATHYVYIEGVPVSFTLVNPHTYAPDIVDTLYLASYNNSSQWLDADIGLLRIWSKALSASEVVANYNLGNPGLKRFEKNEDITLELYADNATESNWYDTSVNKVKGTIAGTVSTSSILPAFEGEATFGILDSIPSNLYIAEDRELNTWFDSFLPYYYKDNYVVDCICSEGATMDRSFRFTPATPGAHSLTISVSDFNKSVLASKVVTINAVSKSAGSGIKQILFIADSTIDSEPDLYLPGRTKYEMLHEISDLFIADGGASPLFLGLRGDAPYKHQAHSGYSSDLFITNNPLYPNPFWDAGNARNDFKKYMADNAFFGGADRIDFACIQLGINDLKNGGSASTVISRFETLIADILDPIYGYPSAEIIISATPYSPLDRTGWALHFLANQSFPEYIKNMTRLAELVVTNFHENVAHPNVFVSPTFLFVDRKYGYPRGLINVSDRSTVQEYQFLDSVHPGISGYKEAADSFYSRLRSRF